MPDLPDDKKLDALKSEVCRVLTRLYQWSGFTVISYYYGKSIVVVASDQSELMRIDIRDILEMGVEAAVRRQAECVAPGCTKQRKNPSLMCMALRVSDSRTEVFGFCSEHEFLAKDGVSKELEEQMVSSAIARGLYVPPQSDDTGRKPLNQFKAILKGDSYERFPAENGQGGAVDCSFETLIDNELYECLDLLDGTKAPENANPNRTAAQARFRILCLFTTMKRMIPSVVGAQARAHVARHGNIISNSI